MNFTDFRLKIRHFFRKNKKIIYIIVVVWLVIFLINQLLKLYTPAKNLETTYEPHTSVMDSTSKVPEKYQNEIEEMIDKYVTYCNNNDFDKAYQMISSDCKKYAYPTFSDFIKHLKVIMYTPKKYFIQDYSNMDNMYIYAIKYTDDILATGLTNSQYTYTEEKMAFTKNSEGTFDMTVGNYIKHEDLGISTENEYLKIEVKDKTINYGTEKYDIVFTNRSEYSITVLDKKVDDEIVLNLSKENRLVSQTDSIILEPGETKELTLSFDKFVDDNDTSYSIGFNQIRVLNEYYGSNANDEEIEDALTNAVAKLAMSISVEK